MMHFPSWKPSALQMNPLVRACIISETFVWSSHNMLAPIFGLFVANQVPGGSLETAAFAYSIYLVVRVVVELLVGRIYSQSNDMRKLTGTIIGLFIASFSYLCFALSGSVEAIYLSYVVAGIGLGTASPPKNALFSIHLDKNKEAYEWSIHDMMVFLGMAAASSIGGIIATHYGFGTVFLIATFLTWVSIFPYIYYAKHFAKGQKLSLRWWLGVDSKQNKMVKSSVVEKGM